MLRKLKTWPWVNLKVRQYYWHALALIVAITLAVNATLLFFMERYTIFWWGLAAFGAIYPAVLAAVAWVLEPRSTGVNLGESFQLQVMKLRLHQWMNGLEISSTERQLSRLMKPAAGD